MNNDLLMEDRIKIKGKDGSEYFIYKFIKPRHFLCWDSLKNYEGQGEIVLKKVDLTEFDPETLESNGIWKELGDNVKQAIIEVKNDIENHHRNRMDHARKCRQPKYPNLPRELECVQCHNKIKIPPGVLAKRIEKLNVLSDDYIRGFTCQTCKPTKGRRANVKNVPRELECIQCHNKIKIPPSTLAKRIERLNILADDYIKGFTCQTCKPTKVRRANVKNVPTELECNKCHTKVMRTPSYIMAYAKRKNLTVEEFTKVYVCQSCCCTKGRKKKET